MRHVLMLLSVLCLGCVLGIAPVGLAQTQTSFTQINPTGAASTFANGINSGGSGCRVPPAWQSTGPHAGQQQPGQHMGLCKTNDESQGASGQTGSTSEMIVGYYWDTGIHPAPHSFMLSGSNFSTFSFVNFPGATYTWATGVNRSGQIVGYYRDGMGMHGFMLSGATGTTIDVPSGPPFNAVVTLANGINGSGQIVGSYYDTMWKVHGFLFSGGSFTSFDYPVGAHWTVATGINASGEIVGYYYKPGNFQLTYGFVRSAAGAMTPVDISGAISVQANGIDTSGRIVGVYVDGTGGHGFVVSGGSVTTVDLTGSLYTAINGINDAGQTVGQYLDATTRQMYGFHMP